MDLEKFNEELKNTNEKLENQLENIAKILKANEETVIAVEKNEDMKFLSKNKSEADEDIQVIAENLSSHQKFEFIELEDEKGHKDSVSDSLICNDALLESDGSESSKTSESSFIILESEGCTPEKFEYDDELKEECNMSLKEPDITDNKIIVDDSIDRKTAALSITKYFDDNVRINSYGNSAQVQDGFISLPVEEVENLLSSLKITQNMLKRVRWNLKSNQCSPKLDKNEIVPETCKTCIESSRKTSMDTSNLESCDTCNEKYHQTSPFTVEWGLNAFEIKPNRNCSMKSCRLNSEVNHPFHSNETLAGKLLKKNRNTEYSHRTTKKSNMDETKAEEKERFINHVASCRKMDMGIKEKDEECCRKNHKKSRKTPRKIIAEEKQPFISCAATSKGVASKKENGKYISEKSKKSKLNPLQINGAKNRSVITKIIRSNPLEMEKEEEVDFYKRKNKSLNVKSPVKRWEIDGKIYFMTDEMKRRFMEMRESRRRREERELLYSVLVKSVILVVMLIFMFVWVSHS